MPDQLINILIQLPVVALFIWYFDRVYTRFEAFLREERSERDKVLNQIILELRGLQTDLKEHDKRVDEISDQIRAGNERPSKPRSTTR